MVGRSLKYQRRSAVRALVRQGRLAVTGRVQRHLVARAWDYETVAECICSLKSSDAHKTILDPLRPGSQLDIYRPWMGAQRLYIRFTLDEDGDLYVLSSCRDGEHH